MSILWTIAFAQIISVLSVDLVAYHTGYPECLSSAAYTTYLGGNFELACRRGTVKSLWSCHCGSIKWLGHGCQSSSTPWRYEDRRWGWNCSYPEVKPSGPETKCPASREDQPANCTCPNNHGITSIKGIWSADHRDRVWQVYCREIVLGHSIYTCAWTGYTPLQFYFGVHLEFDEVLTGIASEHSNHAEDRTFTFKICKYCKLPVWSQWTPWGECSKCSEGTFGSQTRFRTCNDTERCSCSDHELMGENSEARQCTCNSSSNISATQVQVEHRVRNLAETDTQGIDNHSLQSKCKTKQLN